MDYDFLNHSIFYEFLNCDFDFGIVPTVIGYERCSKNKDVISFDKSNFCMHYIISGKGYLTINNDTFEINEKQLFFISPSMKVTYKQNTQDPWIYMWVEFSGDSCNQLFSSINFDPNFPIITPKDPEFIFNEFAQFISTTISKNYSGDNFGVFCVAKVLNIFGQLSLEKTTPKNEDLTKQQIKIKSVLEYIHMHYCDDDISLGKIASDMYFNPSYLSRIFKNAMGLTPIKYIIELRMHKAREMLKTKSFTISQISEILGYSSPYYFSLEFKRMMGISPSKYNLKELI